MEEWEDDEISTCELYGHSFETDYETQVRYCVVCGNEYHYVGELD